MTGEIRLAVAAASAAYDVVVGEGLLADVGARVRAVSGARRCALITDQTVGPLFAATVSASLGASGFEVTEIVVPPGERTKDWPRAGEVLERMAADGIGRTDVVLALGGGVIGDLAGFCAAVFARGIDYVQCPTTLLAQVDSSVGGKTGVDLRAGKNLVGAFKQPLLVIADTRTLTSLPDVEWRSGLAEVAKAAMLAGHERVGWMLDNAHALVAREPEAVRTAVLDAIRFKTDVVAADERESSTREVLNYGHTLGHAIERVAGYGMVSHGGAVAEGMRFAARLAERVAGAERGVTELQDRLLLALGIERPSYPADVAALLRAMHADKKARAGTVRFVFVPEPGVWRVEPVPDETLVSELNAWVEADEEGG